MDKLGPRVRVVSDRIAGSRSHAQHYRIDGRKSRDFSASACRARSFSLGYGPMEILRRDECLVFRTKLIPPPPPATLQLQ